MQSEIRNSAATEKIVIGKRGQAKFLPPSFLPTRAIGFQILKFGIWIFSKRLVRTSALPTALWSWISKMPSKLRKNTMPRRFAPRLFLTISQKVKIGGGGGIRTREGLTLTRFPSARTRPLCDPSFDSPTF